MKGSEIEHFYTSHIDLLASRNTIRDYQETTSDNPIHVGSALYFIYDLNEEVLVMLHLLFIGFLALTILYLGLKLKFNEKD